RDGLPVTVLAPDYQRIAGVLEKRRSAGEGPVKAKEIAAELGLSEGAPCGSTRSRVQVSPSYSIRSHSSW
ncbi:hypothetical protein ACWGKM_36350, partial [Streptomyces sp. NPDC054771]